MRPSAFLGLPSNSYEAYCVDEAVIFFGLQLQSELEKAGHKPSKDERKTNEARKRVLDKVLGKEEVKGAGFADPMLLLK